MKHSLSGTAPNICQLFFQQNSTDPRLFGSSTFLLSPSTSARRGCERSRPHRFRRGEEQFAEALLAVVLAALCLESFANEWGEEILESSELADFLRCRRKYQKTDGVGSVAWKLKIVFERKWGHALLIDSGILLEVDALFEMRNALVHYKLGESSAKIFLTPPVRLANPETGEVMTVFDFEPQPTRFEEPLVWRVDAEAAARAYNTALRVVKLWNEKAGAPAEALAAHTEFSES